MRPQRTFAPVLQGSAASVTSRPRPLAVAGVAFLVVVVLLADLAVVGIHLLDENTSLVRRKTPVTTEPPEVLPAPGQAFVGGELERLVAEKAQAGPIPTPLTITGERGVSRLAIETALVGGNRVTISWDGGTPLPISGKGGLELGATHVEITGDGTTWSLDGAGRTFVAGEYSADAPVAVGTGGIATPRDGIEFTAANQTVLVSRGGAVIQLDPGKVEITGPGTLEASGKLRVRYPDRRSEAASVRFGEGPFQATVEPSGGKLRLSAVLQGEVAEG